jgi:hypothetical protein
MIICAKVAGECVNVYCMGLILNWKQEGPKKLNKSVSSWARPTCCSKKKI